LLAKGERRQTPDHDGQQDLNSRLASLDIGGLRSCAVIPTGLAFQEQLTWLRTMSLRTGVSASGKLDFVRRDKGGETPPSSSGDPVGDKPRSSKWANWAEIIRWPGNLSKRRNAWRATQSLRTSLRPEFAANREKYREIREIGPRAAVIS
jgi:hypothetical protein